MDANRDKYIDSMIPIRLRLLRFAKKHESRINLSVNCIPEINDMIQNVEAIGTPPCLCEYNGSLLCHVQN